MENSVDPDKTAPIGALCSGSTLFASILNSSVMLGNYLQQMTSADDIFRCIFFSWRFMGKILQHHSTISYRVRETQLYHGYLRSVRMTSSCLKITRLPKNDHSAFNCTRIVLPDCIKCVTIMLSIASVILCAYSFNTLFLGPAKRGRQSSIYSLTSMD